MYCGSMEKGHKAVIWSSPRRDANNGWKMQGSSCIQEASEKVLDVPQRLNFMSMQESGKIKGVSVLISHMNCHIRVALRGYMEIVFFRTFRGQHCSKTSEGENVLTLKTCVGWIQHVRIHTVQNTWPQLRGKLKLTCRTLFPVVCILSIPFCYCDESVLYFFYLKKEFFFIIICGSVCTVCECGRHSTQVKIR